MFAWPSSHSTNRRAKGESDIFCSEYGALQLLMDFAYVSKWVTNCSIISQNVRDHLLKNEVLRRCEGVGRLLLRHPGEAIAMRKRMGKRRGFGVDRGR